MSSSIVGVEELLKKLNRKESTLRNATEIVSRGAQVIRGGCVMECPVNDGELRKSIKTRVEQNSTGAVGVVYTNKSYAPYVEFGTGPVGAAHHSDISPDVNPSYTMEPWWIPGEKLSDSAKENYHWTVGRSSDGREFYRSDGQPAQPFMYQGAQKTKKQAIREMKKYLEKGE